MSLRIKENDVIEKKIFPGGASYDMELTAPQSFGTVIDELVFSKIFKDNLKNRTFKHLEHKEKIEMVQTHGLVVDDSYEIFEGINLDTLKKICLKS